MQHPYLRYRLQRQFHCVLLEILFLFRLFCCLSDRFSRFKKDETLSGTCYEIGRQGNEKSDQVKKYEFWGLMLFVGIPLPGTGAWTGSLIASLLEIDIKKSSLAIFCGIIMATVIMYIVSYGLVGNLVH